MEVSSRPIKNKNNILKNYPSRAMCLPSQT